MTLIFSYLLKANLVLILLYGFYYLCLRRDTFYGYIRWYLLMAIMASVLFPLTDISPWLARNPSMVSASQYIPDMETVYYYVIAQDEHIADTVAPATIPVGLIVFWCWLPVAVFLLGKRLFQLVSLICLSYRFPRKYHKTHAIIAIDRNIQPFSFFGHIFLNPSLYTEEELDEIIVHEQVHCRNKHTVDILLAEAVVCLCWFNPAAWLLRNDLKINLEYYTDRKTLRSGFDRKHYQYSLLRVSGSAYQIVNHFQFNHLKKRIIMMNRKESSRILSVKYLLAVPALIAALLVAQIPGLQAAGEFSHSIAAATEDITNVVINRDNPDINMILDLIEGSPAALTQTNSIGKDGAVVQIEAGNDGMTAVAATQRIINATQITPDSTITKKEQAPFDISPKFKMRGTGLGRPLIILDGERISSDKMNAIDPNIIESISVLKDASAKAIYGEEASDGVIIITTNAGLYLQPKTKIQDLPELENNNVIPDYRIRQGTTPRAVRDNENSTATPDLPNAPYHLPDIVNIKSASNGVTLVTTRRKSHTFGREALRIKPLLVVDGLVVDYTVKDIVPETVESITVLKDQSAINLYGKQAKNGVVIVTSKKK